MLGGCPGRRFILKTYFESLVSMDMRRSRLSTNGALTSMHGSLILLSEAVITLQRSALVPPASVNYSAQLAALVRVSALTQRISEEIVIPQITRG